MANNITTANGIVATDDVSSVHYQVFKLAAGNEDSTARIGGDATTGLDVDVTRIIPGTGATNLGKAEDAPHASGDTGIMALGVRSDTAASLAGTTGDYTPLIVDASGRQWVNTELPDAAALADGVSNPTVPLVGAGLHLFNGSTWDRQRGNEEFTVLASLARTASTNSATFTNYHARGIVLALAITAASSTGGLRLVLFQKPAASGNFTALNATPTGVTTTGTTYYVFYPGANETNKGSAIGQVISQPLARNYRVSVIPVDSSSYTYEVVGCLIV